MATDENPWIDPSQVPTLTPLEARHWLGFGNRLRRTALALVVAWVGFAALMIVFTWDEPGHCATQSPCGAEWHGAIFIALFVVLMWWIATRPGAALAGLLVFEAMSFADPTRWGLPSWVTALEALLAACTVIVCWLRLQGRHMQADLAQRAGVTAPGIKVAPRTWTWTAGWLRWTAGSVVGALAILGYAGVQQSNDNTHAAQAATITAEVLEHRDDGFVLLLRVDGQEREVETHDAGQYPVGNQVDVLVDGDWIRLVAEPYDPSLIGTVAIVLLLVAATRAVEPWQVARDLRRLQQPHPALRVDVTPTGSARVLVTTPGFRGWLGSSDTQITEPVDEEVDESNATDAAVAHGVFGFGRAAFLDVEYGPQRVQLVPTGLLDRSLGPTEDVPDPVAPRRVQAAGESESVEVPDWLPGTGYPLTFRTARGPVALLGLGHLGIMGLGWWFLADTSSGLGHLAQAVMLTLGAVWFVSVHVSWRVTLDADGVHHRTPWAVHSHSWETIDHVVVEAGVPRLFVSGADADVPLHLAPPPRLLRRATSPISRLGLAARACVAHPHLRPTRPAPLPTSPWLASGSLALGSIAVLVLAWLSVR